MTEDEETVVTEVMMIATEVMEIIGAEIETEVETEIEIETEVEVRVVMMEEVVEEEGIIHPISITINKMVLMVMTLLNFLVKIVLNGEPVFVVMYQLYIVIQMYGHALPAPQPKRKQLL